MAFALYFDDDCADRDLARGLRTRGFDVARATDIGMRGLPDSDHLSAASGMSRAIVSSNQSDFVPLHWSWMAEGRTHSGVIVLTQHRWSVGEQLRRMISLLAAKSPEQMRDQLEFLSRWG